MSYSNTVEKIMLNNGHFSPLKLIYKEIWNYKDKKTIRGKTPNYTIQERVQRDKKFTRIGLGVYALTEYLDKLLKISELKTEKEKLENIQAKMQGMLIEIGNLKPNITNTFTPNKRSLFNQKQLQFLATLQVVPPKE